MDEFWRAPNSVQRVSMPRFNFDIPLGSPTSVVPSSPVASPSKKTFNGFLGRFFSPTSTERMIYIFPSLFVSFLAHRSVFIFLRRTFLEIKESG